MLTNFKNVHLSTDKLINMEHDIFPVNLVRARQNSGLTQEELAKSTGLTKQAISLYEKGLRLPDSHNLLKLAVSLTVTPDYFYEEHNVKLAMNEVSYRKGGLINERQRGVVEGMAADALKGYLDLEIIANESVAFTNPLEDLYVRDESDAEKAAKVLRKKWKLGEGPISNISGLLERKGIRVLKIDFRFHFRHEGLSGWADDRRIPVIVLNDRQQNVPRVRFTILHELGHLLLMIPREVDLDTVERLCDTFAGAVLMPAEVLAQEFGRNRTAISMSELRRIKALYGMSIKAIMVRARMINLITYDSYVKWKSSEDDYPDRGEYMGAEEPQKFEQMLYRCLIERKIGVDKAARLSGRTESQIKQMMEQEIKL